MHNNKFIELINKYKTIVPNNTITSIDSLYTSNYTEDIKANILNSILNSENTNKEGVKYKDICLELLEELLKAMLEYDTLNKKLMCVFGSINTEKQLKDEFPEAYALYIKEFKPEMVNNKSDNKCDAIEEVRAIINSNNSNNN